MSTEDSGKGQDRAAAERSASITRGPDPKAKAQAGAAPEQGGAAYWMEILSPDGQVARRWHCQLEGPPEGYTFRLRPA